MIKTVVFDLYGTLFDIDSVSAKCEKLFPGNGEKIAKAWRQKLIEYIHVRQLLHQYKAFSLVIKDSLEYVLERHEFDYSIKDINECIEAYDMLEPFNETVQVLNSIVEYDKVIFSNGNKEMIEALIDYSEVENNFKSIISLEEFSLYKPDPNSYELLHEQLNLDKNEILFISSNKWDIIGAQNFGYQTAWVNRYYSEFEHIDAKPDYEFQNLFGLKSILEE